MLLCSLLQVFYLQFDFANHSLSIDREQRNHSELIPLGNQLFRVEVSVQLPLFAKHYSDAERGFTEILVDGLLDGKFVSPRAGESVLMFIPE